MQDSRIAYDLDRVSLLKVESSRFDIDSRKSVESRI